MGADAHFLYSSNKPALSTKLFAYREKIAWHVDLMADHVATHLGRTMVPDICMDRS